MSVRTVAAQTGFSPSFISQVENGQASPSITSLERIAMVLGVTLAGFFMTQQQEAGVVTRTGDRWELASAWSQARIEALGSIGGNSHLEAVLITIASGGRSGKQPSSHPGEEFALVFDGEVSLTLGSDVHLLRRGDTASFSSETPHLWENPGPATAQVVIVSPRFTH
jgi:quercetin dioxygenase-like cupin family protein